MSAAVDGLSASAPLAQLSNSVNDGRNLVLSPGGYSYGGSQAHSSNPQRSRTIKQARGKHNTENPLYAANHKHEHKF